MSDKYKIIALFGKSGAGKDTIQKWMVSHLPNTKGIVSCTTRPPRSYEINGIDYHFIDRETFGKKVMDGTMLEATVFNDWFYGTSLDELDKDKINIGVFNIGGIECLLENKGLDVLPILVDRQDIVRLKDSLNREKNPDCHEICRRFLADEKDFMDIEFNYILYKNYDDNRFFNIHNLPEVKAFLGQK